jgi:MFS family permease
VRQALAFGIRAAVWGTGALLWPLVLSLVVGNLTATIAFYIVAIILDVVLFVLWLARALTYSKRASRGETFAIRTSGSRPQTRGIPAKH